MDSYLNFRASKQPEGPKQKGSNRQISSVIAISTTVWGGIAFFIIANYAADKAHPIMWGIMTFTICAWLYATTTRWLLLVLKQSLIAADKRNSHQDTKGFAKVTEVNCWSCKQQINVTDKNRGTKIKCPHCGINQRMPL
jgi:hypothetical protein